MIRRLKPMTKYTSLSYACKRVRFSKANDVKTASYNRLNEKKVESDDSIPTAWAYDV